MEENIHDNKVFKNSDYSNLELGGKEFVECRFLNCNFSGSNLSSTDFIDCQFDGCNFSMAKLGNVGLKTVKFLNCKLIGSDFNVCSDFLFSVSFENCQLDYATFHKKKMKGTKFLKCSMKETDFSVTDLTMAIFRDCDLANAQFLKTILEKADLRTAHNYSIDPEQNRIRKARFSYPGIIGLLHKYQIEVL
jgi:uncharacterized protein YjbI with pentapeptide repeats